MELDELDEDPEVCNFLYKVLQTDQMWLGSTSQLTVQCFQLQQLVIKELAPYSVHNGVFPWE